MRYYDPKHVNPRKLACTECGESILVTETPVTHIDPRLYRCSLCKNGRPPGQTTFEETPRTETIPYSPSIAMMPY